MKAKMPLTHKLLSVSLMNFSYTAVVVGDALNEWNLNYILLQSFGVQKRY